MTIRGLGWTMTALLLAACDSGKNDTSDGPTTGTTSTGESDSDASTDGTLQPTTSAGSASSTTSPTTPATGGEPDTTTGGGEPGQGTCEKFCAMWVECVGETPEEDAMCLGFCSDDLMQLEGECQAATAAMFECQGTLTCAQLNAMEEGDVGPCLEASMVQQDACGFGEVCTFGGGGDGQDSVCSIMRECAGEPLLEMHCTEAACECFADDMKFGDCASEPVCNDFAALQAKALQCCGIEIE